ncbi:hypothetical protein BpHYR1_044601 [Brachionus plicatilis]|uniref:Uncharacterized protein n=1 Tax=Brachionus plicatilis TaxID=10195 RepID=A0A3M7PS44_BRAPC|nr:hypothetical protein BpHYR1_044601 [Brachionus plicatilis]
MSSDLAELRRQKILKNSERRLQLLMGLENSENQTNLEESVHKIIEDKTTKVCPSEKNRIHQQPESHFLLSNEKTTEVLPDEKKAEKNDQILAYTFNGHSNVEIVLFFVLALLSSTLFYLKQSSLMYHNVLLPFFTLEAAHLIVHLKYFPATSSQFQLFRTLLQLCGISQKSLKKLMVALNFLFILIDNFVTKFKN